ncbi:hypothetical protein [Streptomyces avermitilis]|uniref:hypothetical protein n=1 Tax=Streptomyces avermitilis TaxID=33903 RepID=UPI000ABA6A4E|nr:hypothetical protein [Streptomyces avermitilis]
MDPGCSLPVTLNRLDMLIDKQGLERSDVLDLKQLAASTGCPKAPSATCLQVVNLLPTSSTNGPRV